MAYRSRFFQEKNGAAERESAAAPVPSGGGYRSRFFQSGMADEIDVRPAPASTMTSEKRFRQYQEEQAAQAQEQKHAMDMAIAALSTGRSVDSVRPGTALRHNYAFEFDGPVPLNQVQAAAKRYWQEQEQAAVKGAPAQTQQSGLRGERRDGAMSELSPRGGSEGYGARPDEAAKELARQSAQTPWTQSVSAPGGRRMVEQWETGRALEGTRKELEEARKAAPGLSPVWDVSPYDQEEQTQMDERDALARYRVSSLEDRERQLVRQQQEQERSWRIFGAEQSAGKPDAKALAEQAVQAGPNGVESRKPKYSDLKSVIWYIQSEKNGDSRMRAGLEEQFESFPLRRMTEKQKQTLAYLVGTGDYDRASQYLEDISWGLNAQEAEQFSASMAQWAGEHPGLGAAANVASWPLAIPGYFETAGHALGNLVTGENKPVDYNSAAYAGNRFANATGEGVQTAARDWGTETFGSEQAGDAAAFLAGTGLSIGQNATQIALLGPASLPAMGLSAAGSASYDALESGANAGEAFALGTGAGAIELLTERFSLENLVKLSGGYGGKQIVMDVLKQMGVEASEEAASEILNNIWNTAVMGGSSDYRRYVAALIEQGMSPEEAEKEAFRQFYIRNVAESALGGALSGGVMGGGATALNYVNARSAGRQLSGMGGDVTQAVIQEGLDSPKGSRSYQLAQAAQDRLDGGKTVSDAQLGGLYWANVEQIDGENAQDGAGQEGAEMEPAAPEAELSGHSGLRPTWDADAILRREALNGTERVQEGPAQTRQSEKTASTGEAELTRNAAALFEASKSLGQNGQKALAAAYDPGQSAADFFGGFAVYYQAGLTGKDLNAVRSPYAGRLSEAQRFAAYAAGQNDAKASLAKEKAAAPFARTAGDEAGLVYDEFVAGAVESGRKRVDADGKTRTYLDRETAERIDRMAKDLGVRVRFAERADPKGEANGSISGSEIVLERNNPNPVMAVAGHELTHQMQDLAPEEFRAFRDLAVQDSPSDAVEKKLLSYAAHGYTLTHEQAMNEVAADYAGRLMDGGALLERFIGANRGKRSLLQRLRDVFRSLAARLRGEDQKKARSAENRLTAALETAYDAAAANAARLDGEAQGGAQEGETRYSIKNTSQQTLKEQLRNYYNGTMRSSDSFYFGETPSTLSAAGLDALPLTFSQKDFAKSTREKHNVPRRVLNNLNHDLETALFAFSDGDRVGILTGDIDGDGKPLLVGIQIGVQMDAQKVNVIHSAYGLDNPAQWLKNQIDAGKTLTVLDEERANAFLYPYGYLASRKEGIRSIDGSVTQQDGEVKGKNGKAQGEAESGRTRYSLKEEEIRAVQSIGRKSVNELTGEEIQKVETFARRYYQEMGVKSPFFRAWFGDWRANDQTPVQVATERGDTRGITVNEDTGWNIQVSGKVFNETAAHMKKPNVTARPYLPFINDIVKKAILLDSHTLGAGKAKSGNSVMMHDLYAVADIGTGPEVLKLYVEEMNDPNQTDTAKRAYQLQNIERQQSGAKGSGQSLSPVFRTADIGSIADLFAAVKSRDRRFQPGAASKVVDGDGRPLAVYHGTNAQFNVFQSKDGAYWFSLDEDYADAMMEERGGGRIIRAYLNMKNPYYVTLEPGKFSDPNYEKPILRAAKDGGYDGVVLSADTDNELLADTFYVVFNSAQIKSATDNVGTFDRGNPDIRYSLKDGTITKSYDRLLRENDALRERVEYWRGQTRRTTEISTDKKAVARAAKELAEGCGAAMDTEELAGRLQSLYDALTRGYDGKDETGPTYAWEKAEAIARDLAESAVETAGLADEFPELKQTLRDARIVIGREYDGDIRNEDFRRRYFGRLKLTSQGATNVDSVYQELSQDYPSLFPGDITHPADQLEQILDVTDELYTVREHNPFSGDMEQAVTGITNDIVERFFELPQTQATFADRQAARLDAAKAHGKQRVQQTRKQYQEQMQKLREENRQTVQRAVQRERETRARQLRALTDRYAQSRKNAGARRTDSKARERLLNIAKRLQNKKLPEVNRTLLNQYIGELDTTAKSMTGKTLEKLTGLKEWYDGQRDTNPDFIADPRIEKALERLSRRQIADLSAQEVAELTEVLLNIENELRTQRRLIDSLERRDIYAAGEAAIRDIEASAGSRPTGLWSLIDKGVVTETLSPLRMVRRITGYAPDSPLTRVTQELADGQRAMLDYQMKAEQQFAKYTGDKGFTKGFAGPKARGIQIQGMGKDGPVTATITPAMRASLCLHSLNDQNLKHIRDGGITVPDWKLYQKGKIAEAYDRGTTIRLTPSQVRSITAQMTQKERAFAMAAHRYFNQTSRKAINAASEKLKGYSVAQVENYFPIHTDTAFTRAGFEAVKFDGTIEGMGFLKERVNAANPILLRDMSAELEQSIQMHSKYVGLAVPVRNFYKLWNVTTGQWVDGDTLAGYNGAEGGDGHGQTDRLEETVGYHRRSDAGEGLYADAGGDSADKAGAGGIAAWAKDALVQAPGGAAKQAVKTARGYGVRAVVVKDAAIRAQNPSALALTEGGVVYLSDALTDEDAKVVGHHEAVHAVKQRGSAAYGGFLDGMGGELDFRSNRAGEVIDIITRGRFDGQDFMSLTEKQQRTVFDELNAIVWGCYKADAQNAREQFQDVFTDYDGYIKTLKGIMEGESTRFQEENEQAAGPGGVTQRRFEYSDSVKNAVKHKWGGAATAYIDKMMGDLQNGHRPTGVWSRAMSKLRSNYAGAVLTLNASVAMKQAASYPTAAAVLGWGPLAKALKDVGRVDLDLIARYTPLQWYRSKGFSTQELGDMQQASGATAKLLKAFPVLNWVQGVDLLTTRKLWKASEYYVRSHNKALNPGTDAYYRAVAEVYNQVIEETQPNYTTMQRPQLLRSDDSLLANLQMFKTQPFQNFNIVYDAVGELTAAMRRGDRAQIKAARAKAGRAVTSQLAQLAVFAGMTMVWAMLRGKTKKYEDEDGELTAKSILAALGKDMAGGALAGIPFGADAWEAVSALAFGDTYYGMDTVTVQALSGTVQALGGMGKLVGNTVRAVCAGEEVDWRSTRIALDGYLDDASKAAGVPYENVANLVYAIHRQVCIHSLGQYRGEYAAMLWTTDPETKSGEYYDLLYRAMNNSPEEYRALYEDMESSGYFAPDKLKAAMEQRMMKSQGVEHVDELEARYLHPKEQAHYDAMLEELESTALWRQAGGEQQDRAQEMLYELAAGTKAGERYQEKIDAGADVGLTETDYVLYRLALSMADQPNENGRLGTYTNEEVEAAIDMLTGLSGEARSYLWTSSGKSGKSDPYR